DLVVADLPVGYYPDDVQAETFELRKKDGHSYAHHLLIEQSLHYTKAGGYLVFVIPEHLFSTEESDTLNAYLQQHAHIIGIIQVVESTFKSKEHKKSIFILRKKGEETQDVKTPLSVQLPSFKDTNAMEDIMNKINQCFQEAELHQYRGRCRALKNILAINAGSSSLKFQLFAMPDEVVLAKGLMERIGMSGSSFKLVSKSAEEKITEDIKDHREA